MRQQRFNFKKFQARWEQEKEAIATQVARTAENQFKDNFRLQGFIDEHLEKWEPRENNSDPGRAILVKSGRLKRSIRAIPGSNFQKVDIVSDVDYAVKHNEGIGVRKRKFIGKSATLNLKIKIIIRKAVSRLFS
jgi:phage gpG-like protein